MAEIAATGKPRSTTGQDEGRSGSSLPALSVRYFRQMKPQRVYAAEVSWQKAAKPPHGEVTVRLVVAGAQVLPTEQVMDAAKPDARAVFYVTPLAKGWLHHERIEVLAHGRKVQEIPMATKVVTPPLTWFLLFCTFFLPWFILNEIKYGPMASRKNQPEERVVYVVSAAEKAKQESAPARKPDQRVIHHKIAAESEKHIRDNVPAPLDILENTFLERWLLNVPSIAAHAFQQIVGVSGILPVAYYTAMVFLCMTIISAFFHMPKRRKTTGKPIPVTAISKNVEMTGD